MGKIPKAKMIENKQKTEYEISDICIISKMITDSDHNKRKTKTNFKKLSEYYIKN